MTDYDDKISTHSKNTNQFLTNNYLELPRISCRYTQK